MKNYFTFFLSAILYLMIFSSCDSKDDSDSTNTKSQESKVDDLYDANSNLKREFGKALVKSLNESKALRDLIKNESLKMFDNDYDVLYQMIKEEKLENNLTVRQSILKNIKDEALLNLIESKCPTLTIFVPELPENTFSAKLWNTENEIPKVAIALVTSNDVPIINQDGTEDVIESKYIPSFPIIVLKENERVVVAQYGKNSKLSTRSISNEDKNIEFKFLDDCFDRSKNLRDDANSSRVAPISVFDPEIISAYSIYNNVDGWQRDYIYYGITPNTPKGPFKYNFQESITSFSLQGNPASAYNKIADQTGDPTIPLSGYGNPKGNVPLNSAWTGGNFEFKVRIIVNGKNGVGSEIIKYFNATGSDLFNISYVKVGDFGIFGYFEIRFDGLKQMKLNIPIFNWDLDQYASTIKIDIEEIDFTETTVLTESRSVEFASNFSVDVSGGYKEYVKVGLKYGTSQKITSTSTVQRTFTQGNDLLGDVIVNFADNIIVARQPNTATTREYSSGLYSISVEPIRVQ